MIIDVNYDELKGKKISGIYKITNMIDGKVYIGQTKHLRHRISDYLHIQDRDGMTHPIALAIKKYGSDAFKFEVLEYCDPDRLPMLEKYYIEKFDSINNGYNMIMHTSGISNKTSSIMTKSHTGLKESPDTKRKKSNVVVMFNDDHSKFIISDSAKLVGDYLGTTKDMIKNCLRQPSSYHGYYIYYADTNKRMEIYYKLLNKRCVRNLQFISDISNINNLMKKGVETIYQSLDTYVLSYDNIDTNGRPILTPYNIG